MKIFLYAVESAEIVHAKHFSEQLGIEFGYSHEYPTLENAHLAAGADAVSCTPCDMGRTMLEKFRSLGIKYITTRSIGFDHVDLSAAKELGMRVSNVSYTPNGVANYAIMLMMMSLRRMPYIMKSAEVQDYSLRNKLGTDISECTVGVIGTGRIGATTIKHLSGFGCRMIAYDLYPNDEVRKYADYVDLNTLYRQSDVITLHAPANASNHHLVCKESIEKMKNGVCIVNTARGALIDTDALIEGLRSGKVGSAALDVMEHENGLYYYNRMYDIIDNPRMAILRSFPNVILSPHTAFYTDEDVESMVGSNFYSLYHFETGMDDIHELKL